MYVLQVTVTRDKGSVSVTIPFWIARAARQCPNAFRLGRITGEGSFAVLSCKDGESRHVRLFLDQNDANRAMWKMDETGRCGAVECSGDHRYLLIEDDDETADANSKGQALVAVHNSR